MKNLFQETLEFFELSCFITWRHWVEELRIIRRYYRISLPFFKRDFALRWQYWRDNPYRINRKFAMNRADRDAFSYSYGDTPLSTLEFIAKECQLTPKDRLYDLGCGPGRTTFWMHCFLGCEVVGIDCVPTFIRRAKQVQEKFQLEKLSFCEMDMLEVDYSKASAVYLYGTCLEDSFVEILVGKLASLPKGAKVITVSYPLTDYQKEELFELEKSFSASFPWGEAEVFLQKRN